MAKKTLSVELLGRRHIPRNARAVKLFEFHPRLLFWQALKESLKDKARHKEDSCKPFADLIATTCFGKKETNSDQFPRRVAHQKMVCWTELPQSDRLTEWLSQVCSAMSHEVREALQPLTNVIQLLQAATSLAAVPVLAVEGIFWNYPHVIAVVRRVTSKEDANPPTGSNTFEQLGNGNQPLMWGSQRQ